MNCQEFERAVVEVGFDHLTGADAQASAMAHAEICPRCASRLNRERRMTAGLRAFATDEAAISAPERVRLASRAAFDERHGVAAKRPLPLSRTSHGLRWGLAAAAMLLLSVTIIALWLRDRGEKSGASPPKSLPPSISQNFHPTPPAPPAESQKPRGNHRPPPHVARPSGGNDWRSPRPTTESVDERAGTFPLTFVAKPETTEFVQVVRVEISRSTLLLMGLPINIDRGERMIKADLLIGEDGVARAVRLLN